MHASLSGPLLDLQGDHATEKVLSYVPNSSVVMLHAQGATECLQVYYLFLSLSLQKDTQMRGLKERTSILYSGRPGFDSRTRQRIASLKLFTVSFRNSIQTMVQCLK
jgi:hypothetical protein